MCSGLASQLASARQRSDPGLLAQPTQACQAANDFVSTSGQALGIGVRHGWPRQRTQQLKFPCEPPLSHVARGTSQLDLAPAALLPALGFRQYLQDAERQPSTWRRANVMSYDADTAWRADQPASLAVLQIRLIKTVKHKFLTRCPAFVHTAPPPHATRKQPCSSSQSMRTTDIVVASPRPRWISPAGRCARRLRFFDAGTNSFAEYECWQAAPRPYLPTPKPIVRARQAARSSRIAPRLSWLWHGKTAAPREGLR